MRYIDATLKARIEKAQQTLYENANPSMSIWISRHSIPLENDMFLETCKIADATNPSNVSIAARRLTLGRQADRIYAAYVEGTTGKIYYAEHVTDVDDFSWNAVGTISGASDIALCFDVNMVKTAKGKVEIITDNEPWVFWIESGALKGKLLSAETSETIVNSGVTAISAVRGTKADLAEFDQGLLVFHIIDGSIYYKALINEVWQDAVAVSAGPSVTWVDVAAGRTWDYRVVLQCKDSAGNIYELFTRSEIAGLANVERIDITDIEAESEMIPVDYIDTAEDEHIELSEIAAMGEILYALTPLPMHVENINDGAGDWGKYITVEFDYPITGIADQAAQFVITDGNSMSYTAQAIEYVGIDNKTIKLTYLDFNGAYGTDCTLVYTPGTISGPAVILEAFSFEFTPTNLVPSAPATPESIVNSDAKTIIITFDGNVSSADFAALKDAFAVAGQEYDKIPGGTLQAKTYVIDTITFGTTNKELVITLTAVGRMLYPSGNVTVAYNSSTGNLTSAGGAVASFSLALTPISIVPVFNPNDLENVEITNIAATGTLTRIYYINSKEDENIEISNITATGVLTHIDDIET